MFKDNNYFPDAVVLLSALISGSDIKDFKELLTSQIAQKFYLSASLITCLPCKEVYIIE